ncbi:PaaI family thioesterase [Algihabitans albus]|uniref:PaaI family thioesterase n=1 Tax=Algihabitans albus TaxID=2164067 RepID=UPI0013C2AE5B|nr:PaaI family thioesterase [Algihabitans albus]
MTDDPSCADPSVFLSQLPFVKEYRINLVSSIPGEVVVEMPVEQRFSTPPANVPASIVGTIGDVAAVSSCLSKVPQGWAVATLDFTVKMIGPASGEKLIARGRVLQNGRTNSIGAADIYCVKEGAEIHCGTLLATTRNFEIKR